MDIALLMARLLLGGVFGVAGLAKLVDRVGSRQTIIDFGLPAQLAAPFSLLLPLAELVVALALFLTRSAWWGGIGALILLVLFLAGISFTLAHGRTPDCHCFGKIYSARAGWPTLLRNAILALIAGFIIWQGPQSTGLPLGRGLVALPTVPFWGDDVVCPINRYSVSTTHRTPTTCKVSLSLLAS